MFAAYVIFHQIASSVMLMRTAA